ncbi:DUF1972 domain-containing protein [Vibrio sp. SCSIO 43136]|uniref:DUF1972 domain-containing protein n=1 Tax=Vibrio sp. SCSIO 43136 TaxID=2819101 RepID=UPI002075121E|nr:DUF1972 domain-containing protein [Vibrio sp. SCSIO 43136]USD65121.1 DUF1972 domain-containing protein [Vibrio sp. SCSIO 43136]
MKTIFVIGTAGIPACYGGFESLVENLVNNASDEIKYSVFCSSYNYTEKLDSCNGANLVYLPIKANGMQSVPYDIWSLIKCLKSRPDIVLILGVSGCIFLPIFSKLFSGKIITNIDGMEWRRGKWNKLAKKFLKISESMAVKYSDSIVTDNKAIYDYVRKEYGVDSAVIAYGGDHAIRNIEIDRIEKEYALSICRIEPENNIEMILKAFSRTDEHLKFVGNWGSNEYGQRLKKKYSTYDNIDIIEPIYDLDVLYSLRRNCSVYIHGHSAGGTNPSLVEMMHFDVPIIAYDCDFNRHSTHDHAIYFSNSEDLRKHLAGRDESWILSGRKLLSVARENYTWSQINEQYENLY